jgi:hypothetical protein
MRVFDNRVLKILFRPKMDEVTGEWRRLRNEERYDLCSSTSIIRVIKSRRMRWVGHGVRMGDWGIAYRVWRRKPEDKRPLERPRRKLKDNIRMDLQEVGLETKDWIPAAQDRERWRALVNS